MNAIRLLVAAGRDCRASVATESAVLIPLLVILFVGCAEAYFYFRTAANLEQAVVSTAGLVARQNTLTACTATSDTDSTNVDIYVRSNGVATIVAQPVPLANSGEVILSGVVDSGGGPTVAWQRQSPYTIHAASAVGSPGSSATLPGTLGATVGIGDGDTLIAAEVFYVFAPFPGLTNLLPGLPLSVTIQRRAYARSRYGNLGTLNPAADCPTSS